jgi:hypothetical protein
MYESFAAKLPMIARPVGNIGDYPEYLRVTETPSEMAKEASALLNDEQSRNQMSKNAFELWKKEYIWTLINYYILQSQRHIPSLKLWEPIAYLSNPEQLSLTNCQICFCCNLNFFI